MGRVLEVLARKAAEGVHVRVMYDGTCEFTTLPRDYPKRLERLGITCKVFSPLTPLSRPIIITETTEKCWSLTAKWALRAA